MGISSERTDAAEYEFTSGSLLRATREEASICHSVFSPTYLTHRVRLLAYELAHRHRTRAGFSVREIPHQSRNFEPTENSTTSILSQITTTSQPAPLASHIYPRFASSTLLDFYNHDYLQGQRQSVNCPLSNKAEIVQYRTSLPVTRSSQIPTTSSTRMTPSTRSTARW